MPALFEPWLSGSTAKAVLTYAHYLSPPIIFLVFLTCFISRSVIRANRDNELKPLPQQTGPGGKPLPRTNSPSAKTQLLKTASPDFSPARKSLFIILHVLLLLTFVGNATIVVIHALAKREQEWWCGQAFVIYVVATFFTYSLILISIIDTHPAPSPVHVITWIVSIILDIICLGASFALYSTKHHVGKAFDPNGGPVHHGFTAWESLEIFVDLSRIICLLLALSFYGFFVFLRFRKNRASRRAEMDHADETTSLLNGNDTTNGHATAKLNGHADTEAQTEDTAGWVRPDKIPSKTWWEYVRGYSIFFPYLWPAKSRGLQVIVLICMLLLLAGRVLNLLIPYQVGKIVDLLSWDEHGLHNIPYGQIALFILFRLLQGGSGIVNSIRSVLWVPIGQYSYRALSVAAFEHVHSLSLDFHLGKKTGEVLSALNKGSSINNFLEQVTFQMIPMVVDLGIAIIYFTFAFDIYYALIVALVAVAYMYVTIRLASWRADLKREVTNLSRTEEATKNDSLISYQTVKYFNAEEYEFARYRNIVNRYQAAEYTVLVSLNLMNVTQNICFTLGLMGTCFLAAFQISIGQRHVGQFVTLLTYMAQLQAPLNFFGTFYRMIQSSMINSERMLELFKERPSVVDKPGVDKLISVKGEIRFRNVSFYYDPRRPAVDGVDFLCPQGTTTAVVGDSGAGKSTIFSLLYRFYNIKGGSIEIDGTNVEDVTFDSFRSFIGVVPQDTVLFNETIMYNLKYANQNATDEQVYDACRAASIHQQILEFPDGYNARVGERGLKLSGGEKQRIAIARTILKDPKIIMLDEATAALDTETEQNIQEALDRLTKNRTTLVIAHRLSTVVHADQILVLSKGKVIERGTHKELLALHGKYTNMWERQIKAQQALELDEAAQKLRREALEPPPSSPNHSEDEGHVQLFRGRAPVGLQMTPAEGGNAQGSRLKSHSLK